MISNSLNEKIVLNNGIEMPMIGLGTYPTNGVKLALLVRKAVKLGYRSFDIASAYGYEKWLGMDIRLSGVKRSDLFITTKASNAEQRTGDVISAFNKSKKRLGFKQVDLYLMHWPNPDTYLKSWKQMETLYKEGMIRAIGVCNFHEHHLSEILKIEGKYAVVGLPCHLDALSKSEIHIIKKLNERIFLHFGLFCQTIKKNFYGISFITGKYQCDHY